MCGENAVTDGENAQIAQLYMELFPQMTAYANSALGNRALAEEAVQEPFRIACMKPEQLCDSPNPRGWLFNTLKYVIQNTRKIRNRAINLLAEYTAHREVSPSWSEDAINPDVLYEDVLNSEEYQLLKAYALEGKSLLELAQARGITLNACKKRLQRAKEMLKQKILNA